jgi:3-hydroxyisobutyrate dehydrogenase
MNVCEALYAETEAMGRNEDDMIAVVQAIEARTGQRAS